MQGKGGYANRRYDETGFHGLAIKVFRSARIRSFSIGEFHFGVSGTLPGTVDDNHQDHQRR